MRWLSWLCAGVVLGVVASHARAQAPAERPRVAATLEYARADAAARCPNEVELRDAVSRELGYPVFDREPATRAVHVQIEGIKLRGRDVLRARFELRDAAGAALGERAIESKGTDCVELASALTLALGLALDPSYLLNKGGAEQPAQACPVCAVCPPQQASDSERVAPPPPVEPEEPSSWRGVRVGAGVALGVGALPAASGAGVIHAGATWTRASIALEAVLHPGARGGEIEATAGNDPVKAELVRGQLAACGHVPLASTWTFDACGLGALGALRGRGVGTGRQDASLAASAGARAGLTLALTDLLFMQGRLDAQANLVRTTLNVEGEPAWTSPPLWGELSMLMGVRVW